MLKINFKKMRASVPQSVITEINIGIICNFCWRGLRLRLKIRRGGKLGCGFSGANIAVVLEESTAPNP
jgi:hypothetical protein